MGLGKLLEASASPAQWLFLLGQVALVGFCEELLFRGMIQRAFHRLFGEDSFSHVFLAVFCSGLIFGCAHLVNLDRGNPPLAAVFQAGVNAFIGMYYCAVFFRTGKNIWYVAALHGLYDLVGMIANGRVNGASQSSVLNVGGGNLTGKAVLFGILLWGLVYLLPTLFILRPKKIQPLLTKQPD